MVGCEIRHLQAGELGWRVDADLLHRVDVLLVVMGHNVAV